MTAGRLAPTPSGDLHLGNITAFYAAWLSARQRGARLLLRMEDVDTGRARPDVEVRQRDCLSWLGLRWDEETPRQSERSYAAWLDALKPHTYRCVCSRTALRSAEPGAPHRCRDAEHGSGAVRLRASSEVVHFLDRRHGAQAVRFDVHGDPVLVRSDGLVAYPLAVVVDDIRDGVTEVVRGDDLLTFSAAQERLWLALGATPPSWHHTPLVLGPDGRKLSKSHGSAHIGALREAGWSAEEVLRAVGQWLGVGDVAPEEAVRRFSPTSALPHAVQLLPQDLVGNRRLAWRPAPTAEP